MGNWVNDKLVVRGNKSDVSTFMAVALDLPTLSEFDMPEDALFSGGEPMDIVIEGPDAWKQWTEIKYGFQTKNYIPDEEIIQASKQYPQLCFILACCDLNGDEYQSWLIYRGETQHFRLSDEKAAAYRESETIDEDSEDYDLLSGWELMDELIAHWDEDVAVLLNRQEMKIL